MRAHKLSLRFLVPALALATAVLLPAAIVYGHPDALGTRFVSPATGADTGDCNDNHHPCRTLLYALTQVEPGNAIKLAAGTYDVSGIDVENLLVGKEGVRGGFSAEDHFAIQNAETNPTRVSGVPDAFRNNFIAHGFIVVDANGDPLPRIIMPKLLVPTACTGGMAGTFPCHNIDYLAQVQLQEIPGAPTSASEIWGLVDLDDNREYAILGHRNGTAFYDVTTPATPVLVANIPGNPSLWREVKAYQVFDAALGRHRAYAYATTEAPGGGLQIFDLTNLPNSVTLANTLTALQHVAHAVHLQHQLRDQRGAARRHALSVHRRRQRRRRCVPHLQPGESHRTDAGDGAARGHGLHARLHVDADHRQPHHAVRERSQPLRSAGGLQRIVRGSVGRHG